MLSEISFVARVDLKNLERSSK